MKLSKQLMFILSLTLCCGLFICQSEIKAQTNASISAIKGKRKVYVFTQSGGAQNRIEQVLKTTDNLEVVTKPGDVEFSLANQ